MTLLTLIHKRRMVRHFTGHPAPDKPSPSLQRGRRPEREVFHDET